MNRFVSDYCVQILGASEPSIVQFIIASASSPSSLSPTTLAASLVSAGFPQTAETNTFAAELFKRVDKRVIPIDGGVEKRRREMLDARRERERRFDLIEDSSMLQMSVPTLTMDGEQGRKGRKERQERQRERKRVKRDTPDPDSDSSLQAQHQAQSQNQAQEQEPEQSQAQEQTQEQAQERERQKDIAERDAFAERIRERDLRATKQIVKDKHASGVDEAREARRTLGEDAEARNAALPDLRRRARETYLQAREQQQLALLRKQIADEELLFEGVALTKRETQRLAYDREVLRLAEERARIDTGEDGYEMPTDYVTEKGKIDRARKEAALYARYQGGRDDKRPVTEQDAWEAEQAAKASINPNPKQGGAGAGIGQEEEYEYVFDTAQQIAFIQDVQLPGTIDPKLKLQTEHQIKQESMKQTRESLPMFTYRQQLLDAIDAYQVLIVVGETGSGKTTQIPQFLHESGVTKRGMVGCTQPRRVAAMSVAARVADEMDVRLGDEVGYSVRFEDATSDKTKIKYMTDGMLLREFMTDPSLGSYAVMMIDEAHERTLATDVLFGLVKDIARFRPDFKLLISSATMDAEKFSAYFDDAPIFNVPGRRFPVDIHYTPQPEANYLHAAITTIFQIHTTQGKGDILVFFTGQDEIEAAAENLSETCRKLGSKIGELIIAPIYANLPSELQAKIFEPTPPHARKVVLATNIAETSITIDGVVFVIDPGFVKENTYNPKTGMEALVITPCSRASANQRSGRAGRVGPGKCFRLYTKWAFYNELEESTTPEIQRTNLGSVVLLLKSIGINDLLEFDFLDRPPAETLIRALELLYALGALNVRGELTKIGRQMAEFPTSPQLAKTILASQGYGCTARILSVVAMLGESGSLFYRPKDKIMFADQARASFIRGGRGGGGLEGEGGANGGDHLMLLNIWSQFVDSGYSYSWAKDNYLQFRSLTRARDVRDQLQLLCERVEIPIASDDPGTATSNSGTSADAGGSGIDVQKAICAGFFSNAAHITRDHQSYRTLKASQTIFIHPSSALYNQGIKWICYYELVSTSKEFVRGVMGVKVGWLKEVGPHIMERQSWRKRGGVGIRGFPRLLSPCFRFCLFS